MGAPLGPNQATRNFSQLSFTVVRDARRVPALEKGARGGDFGSELTFRHKGRYPGVKSTTLLDFSCSDTAHA